MSTGIIINLVYVASAVLFIFGLKLLGSPDTARRGNLISAAGMFIAVVVTLLDQKIIAYEYIALGIVLGALVGAVAARKVAMTGMPELVALFNGFGGLASLMVGWAALAVALSIADATATVPLFTLVTVFISILIGGSHIYRFATGLWQIKRADFWASIYVCRSTHC